MVVAPLKAQIIKKLKFNKFYSSYSTLGSSARQTKKLTSVKTYENAKKLKKQLIQENLKLSGVYCLINSLNNKTYVGSSVDLGRRFNDYFNKSNLIRDKRMIHSALLKYGHENFQVCILEYCSQGELIKREQYYMDLIEPDYNILKFAYSTLGRIVGKETRKKLSLATKLYRELNPLSDEALANLKVKTTEREGVAVKVLNTDTNEVLEFSNQTEAGKFLGITRQGVRIAIKKASTVKGVYLITDASIFTAEALANHQKKSLERGE
jgi:hypothetical protein